MSNERKESHEHVYVYTINKRSSSIGYIPTFHAPARGIHGSVYCHDDFSEWFVSSVQTSPVTIICVLSQGKLYADVLF